ncbi:class I SAM-dependent methyltransferase [Salipaludibacillus daqingensis]|uniref:class I SAM-dependent methyltransferase n=1 Tax=Salipaludibacillus daqingensis TaxID=3041001 RepID=UPI0024735682|nr:methyltransferase domain-containing protein [Salipaludibacillus daqingensis]
MLKDTGERVIVEEMKPTNGMLLEHVARYYFASAYVKGNALDIACGTGYGTKMIAKGRKREISSIIGVDIDQDAITYAIQHYYHPLLGFKQGDALDKNLKNTIGTFDTILSFETIEHVPNDKDFLENLYELLAPGGTLVLSTPFGEGRGKPCGSPFHYHQLTEEEFTSLFKNDVPFEHVEFYYQHGVMFEKEKREGLHYPLGIAVCRK